MELAAWVGDISDLIKPMDEPQKKEVSHGLDFVGHWSLLGQVWGGAVMARVCPVFSFN